ncbi:MAG TPA: ABC transporter substrate-binding protein [Trebonia sp.]|nr:ABC transporter substrate-binding protein [Trebonia sp.]
MKKPNRRGAAALAAGSAVAALLIAGCSTGASQSSSAASSGSGTLVFGITADATQLVPWTATAEQSVEVLQQLYSPLLNTDSNGNLIPGLSSLPTVSDNGYTYTFTLKSGVKFADGKPLTSADVKYTFDTIMKPSSAASSASYFANVASVSAPSASTVVVHMKTPDASFPSGLSTIQTGIVPNGATAATLQSKPDGSGPYQLVSHVSNESLTLSRNADYFAGKPGAATLKFQIIPNDQSMVSALRTGAVDAAIFSDQVTAKTATSSSVTIDKVGSLQYHVLQLRAASPVLSNVNTRLAIQCAVSAQGVVDSAALGAGQVTGPITSPQYKSNPADQPCPTQNLTKAKQYLAKAGQPNGFTLNLITSQGLYASAVDEAQAIQSQLGQIGIKVNVQTLSASAYVSDWLSGNFEAAIAENAGNIDPNTMYARYFTSTGSFNKVAGYSSPTLNSLFAQGIATTNVAQRQKIYQEISAQLVDNAAWVWLYTPEEFIAVNTSVHGFQARTDADLSMLWKASIS